MGAAALNEAKRKWGAKKQTFFFFYIFLCIPKTHTQTETDRPYIIYIYTTFCSCKQHTNVIYIFCQATITTTEKQHLKTTKTQKKKQKNCRQRWLGKVGAVCEGGRKASRNHWECPVTEGLGDVCECVVGGKGEGD